jgi:hypothetical protein
MTNGPHGNPTRRPGPVALAGLAILPGDPPEACPELLTAAEAVRYLRLDTVDIEDPAKTLDRYRAAGRLRGTQVSKRVFYRRVELDAFLANVTEDNPR